jgi:hypothetical protein
MMTSPLEDTISTEPFDLTRIMARACEAKGYALDDLNNACVWMLNNRVATRDLGGLHAQAFDVCEALYDMASHHFSLSGLTLVLDDKRKVAMLFKKPPASDEQNQTLKNYRSPDIGADALLAGLYSLCSARESALKSGKIDPKSGLALVEPIDVHRLMDAQFARKILSAPKKQEALWVHLMDLGFAMALPGIDASRYANPLTEAPKLVSPAIETLIGSDQLRDALAAAKKKMDADKEASKNQVKESI